MKKKRKRKRRWTPKGPSENPKKSSATVKPTQTSGTKSSSVRRATQDDFIRTPQMEFAGITQPIDSLVESEYWQRLVDHLPVGAVSVADGRVHMNRAAEALTGYARDELDTPDRWFETLYGPRAKKVRAAYEVEKQHGFRDTVTTAITRKDGTERVVEIFNASFDDIDIAVLHDVTDKQALQRRLLEIAGEEQRRIGRELHDIVLQALGGLGLLAESLAGRLEPRSAERKSARKLAEGLAQLNEQVRLLCEGLIPPPFKAGDLQAALGGLLHKTADSHGLHCSLEADQAVAVDGHTAQHLYRIAQEAVTNAVRHSRAKSIKVELKHQDGVLALEVLDDGMGVDESAKGKTGLGTQIMQYRCNLIGGRFDIHRRCGGGTRVVCRIPPGHLISEEESWRLSVPC